MKQLHPTRSHEDSKKTFGGQGTTIFFELVFTFLCLTTRRFLYGIGTAKKSGSTCGFATGVFFSSRLFLTLIAVTTTSVAYASDSSDDAMQTIFQGHKDIIQELAKDYVAGPEQEDSTPAKPKSDPLKIHIVSAFALQQPSPTPIPLEYTFSSKTVWANLTAHITDFHGHFRVAVESDSPIDGWIIKRISSKKIVTKGAENSAYNFTFDVQETFSNDYSLTVMVTKDGMTNPALLPLKS